MKKKKNLILNLYDCQPKISLFYYYDLGCYFKSHALYVKIKQYTNKSCFFLMKL